MSNPSYLRLPLIVLLIFTACVWAQPIPFEPIPSARTVAGPVVADQGMVVSEQKLASQIGIDILRAGGNAVDAAVAVGYALAVVNPCCGNLGGGGFMTLHLANGNKNIFINFRERAPLAAKTNMYLDAKGNIIPGKSTVGYLAVGVPGTVLGLETALHDYGTMTREQVMAPAIKLAEQGYILTAGDVNILGLFTKQFKSSPDIAAIFLKDGQAYQAGDLLIQKDLANSLRLIVAQGAKAFYAGIIAQEIVNASTEHGGILSLQDFSQYKVEILTPVNCNYRGYTVISAPPPSSGGTTICEMLNILEAYPLTAMGRQSTQSIHDIIEAMRFGFYDRNNKLGDPDFIVNPVEKLTSKKYADQIRKRIKPATATPSAELKGEAALHEGVNTTHYSIIDKAGNAVAVTYTLNSFFGALVMAKGTGFFLNNEMDDFTSTPNQPNQFGLMQGENNKIEPGKRPLSAMSPTIILKNNQPMLVVGSPGGPRIINATLLTILNVIDFGMNIQQAIDAHRFHHQWLPDVIEIEPDTFSADTLHRLNQMGYRFKVINPFGAVEAIYIDPSTHKIYGGYDGRRNAGLAVGY
jgi:gamma-glutamyltranspeptidase / glutathione hydrolase